MSNKILDKVLAELDGLNGKALKKHMGFASPDDEAAEGEPGQIDSPEEEIAEGDDVGSSLPDLSGLSDEDKRQLILALQKEE